PLTARELNRGRSLLRPPIPGASPRTASLLAAVLQHCPLRGCGGARRSASGSTASRRDRNLFSSLVLVGLVVLAEGLDVVLLHELAEVLAVDVGLAGGVGDVAAVLLQERDDVVALEGRDPALLRLLEGGVEDLGGRALLGRRRRLGHGHGVAGDALGDGRVVTASRMCSGRSWDSRVSPSEKETARSMALTSSRTLPGQE